MSVLAFRRVVLGTIFIASLARLPPESAMSDVRTAASPNPEQHCVGRFDFALPAAMRSGGREQSLYLVRVWSESVDRSADPMKVWAQQTAPLRHAPDPMQPTPLLREVTLPGVGPAALYRTDAGGRPGAPEQRKLLSMKPFTDHAVFLESTLSEGHESAAAEVISQIARSYAPASANGFCVAHGAFLVPPSVDESARSAFEGAGGLSLSLETETVDVPMPPPTPEQVAADAAAVIADGGRLNILLQRERAAAGLAGQELRVAVTDKEAVQKGSDPELIYTWIFAGASRADALRPHISLTASAPSARRAGLDTAWEMLLNTLKRRPAPR
jgi:hypothetical protein